MLLLIKNIILTVVGAIVGYFVTLFTIPFYIYQFGFEKTFARKERTSPQCVKNSRWGNHKFMTLEGTGLRMHYVEKGDSEKPLMMFLHGFPEFWYSWRFQIEHKSTKYWCVAPDLRGYGETDKPSGIENYTQNVLIDDIKDLIHGLGRSECILVGHDWGGILGYDFVAKYPEMVKAYIPINIPHPLSLRKQQKAGWEQRLKSWYMIFFQCPVIPEFICGLADLVAFDEMFNDAGLNDKANAAEDIEAYKYMFRSTHNWTCTINYYRAAAQIPSKDIVDRLWRIKVPVYSIFGTGDNYLSVASAQGSKDYCSDFEETLIDGVKHWSPMQVPDQINKLIDDYLKKRDL